MKLRIITESDHGIRFKDIIYLFRGIGGPPNPFDRIGRWWSTNPYYALSFGSVNHNQTFVAGISKNDLTQGLQQGIINDVTQDEYPNFIFQNDPHGARKLTPQEVLKFRQLSGDVDQQGNKIVDPNAPKGPGSGGLFKQLFDQDAIDAAYQVMG